MRSTIKKLISLGLIGTMSFSMCACSNSSDSDFDNSDSGYTSDDIEDSEAETEKTEEDLIYDAALGEFQEAYEIADQCEDVNERYALMAVAEAKLLESAVFLPTTTEGGTYVISRVAPYTSDFTLWGSDMDRYHQSLVATDYINAEDRNAMKEKWKELRGTGEYEQWAKDYLKEKGYTLSDTFSIRYSVDPTTWDIFATSETADADAIINTYDGLMEYDDEGTLQPALATDYTVSDDGLTYTFTIREGQKWVDSQGRELDDITADDFVAGMQHALDAQGGFEYIVDGVIENATEYINGEITDFSQVGVKAVDEYTLQYTLTKKCSYFTTMLGYSIFAPLCRSYYESMGGKFGVEYNSADSDYKYGIDSDSIAYCGPYLVTNATEKNKIVFSENKAYWNNANINIKTINWVYEDDSDTTKAYEDMKQNILSYVLLNASTIKLAKKDGLYDEYAYVSGTTATTFSSFVNLNRTAFANYNDSNAVVSTETDEEKAMTKAAVNNVHFRRAIAYGVDRASYNGQEVGEDLKYNSLRNSYVPYNFVTLSEDVTIQINGEDQTFKAGTYYGQVLQAQLDADGSTIQAYEETADDGNGSGDGYDGWYNPEEAAKEMAQAVEELKADGFEITKDNPVVLELPYPSSDENYTNKANAYKQSVEKSLDGLVEIRLSEAKSLDEWYYAGYYIEDATQSNYDLYDLSGWGPDFGDPSTYLNTMLPGYNGYLTKCIGLY